MVTFKNDKKMIHQCNRVLKNNTFFADNSCPKSCFKIYIHILRRAVELGGPTAKSAYNSKLLSIFLLDYRSGQELQVKKEVGDCRFLPSDFA